MASRGESPLVAWRSRKRSRSIRRLSRRDEARFRSRDAPPERARRGTRQRSADPPKRADDSSKGEDPPVLEEDAESKDRTLQDFICASMRDANWRVQRAFKDYINDYLSKIQKIRREEKLCRERFAKVSQIAESEGRAETEEQDTQVNEAIDSLENWLLGLDGGYGSMLCYLEAIQREFKHLEGLRASFLEESINGSLVGHIDPAVWGAIGADRAGHRLLIAKGIKSLCQDGKNIEKETLRHANHKDEQMKRRKRDEGFAECLEQADEEKAKSWKVDKDMDSLQPIGNSEQAISHVDEDPQRDPLEAKHEETGSLEIALDVVFDKLVDPEKMVVSEACTGLHPKAEPIESFCDKFPGAISYIDEDIQEHLLQVKQEEVVCATPEHCIAWQLPLRRSPRNAAMDRASNAQSHVTRETFTSGISVRSAAGSHPKCFLSDTLFRCPDGSFAHVEDIQQHETLIDAHGFLVDVIKVIHHPPEGRLVTTLRTSNATLRVTSDHRITIPRGLKWQTIPAGHLAVGDSVLGEGGEQQMIESIENDLAIVEVFEIGFNPDVAIETFYDKSAAILTNGSKRKSVITRRSGMNRGAFRSIRGIDGCSIPATDTPFL